MMVARGQLGGGRRRADILRALSNVNKIKFPQINFVVEPRFGTAVRFVKHFRAYGRRGRKNDDRRKRKPKWSIDRAPSRGTTIYGELGIIKLCRHRPARYARPSGLIIFPRCRELLAINVYIHDYENTEQFFNSTLDKVQNFLFYSV